MSVGTLGEVAAIVDGDLAGEDRSFVGVSTDTRTLKSGQLYFALRGPNFDAHNFLGQAAACGAAAAVVETHNAAVGIAQVVVADTRVALGRFAGAWRRRFDIDVAAVTGSNGKTSVKEMLAAILRTRSATLCTRGNFNNDVGVPLTLLRLTSQHQAAVIEIGASARGEVGKLAALAAPRVGIITNAAAAHLSGFGSIDAVARAKGELIGALPGDGFAVLNRDDRFFPDWRALAGERQVVTFGDDERAAFYFSAFSQRVNGRSAHIEFTAHTPTGSAPVSIPVGGRHNARNAMSAIAAASALGVTLSDAVAGLADVDMAAGRLQVMSARRGARVIDDSYNANPASTRAAIDFLADQSEPGWLVLGDMKELGDEASHLHAQIGKRAREQGVARLFAVGDLSRAAAVAFGEGARWFESRELLEEALLEELEGDVNVLVKASRSMRLEQVVEALRAPADNNGKEG